MNTTSGIQRGIVRGTVGIALNRIVDGLIGLLMVPFILHRLGTDAYGLWALLYAVISYFNLADFGFGASLNRHFTEAITKNDPVYKRNVFSTAFASMFAIAGLIFIVGLSLEPVILRFYPETTDFGHVASWAYRCLVWVLALGYLSNYFRSMLVSSQRVDRMALLQIIVAIGNAAMIVFVLSMKWGLFGLALGSAFFAVVRFAMFATAGALTMGGLNFSFRAIDKAILKKMWGFGIVVQMARFAEMVNNQFDRLLLGRVAGLTTVTNYDLGAKAANSTNLMTQIVLYVIEPAATALHTSGERDKFSRLVIQSSKYMGIAAFGLALFLAINTEELLTLWLGSFPNPGTVLALRFLLFAYIAGSLTLPVRLAARGAGFPKWEATYAAVQATINIALSIGLFYLFGLLGVLLGTLVAAAVGQTFLLLRILRGLEIPVLPFFGKAWSGPILASLAAGLASWLCLGFFAAPTSRFESFPALIVSGLAFAAAFFAFLFLTRTMTVTQTREILGHLKRKKG